MSNKSSPPIVQEIWQMLKETQKNLKEGHKEFRAGHKEFRSGQKELQASHKEFYAKQKELQASHDRVMRKMEKIQAFQEKTDRQMAKTDIRINKMLGDSGNRWGKLGENLVKGSLAQRLRERGIEVEKAVTNAKLGDVEFDIIAINGKEIVIVEVKATLDPSDVEEFKEDIKKFKLVWPEFKDKTVYGAMAYLIKANRQANNLAQKAGFFVIEATGDVIIQNKTSFKPRVFS